MEADPSSAVDVDGMTLAGNATSLIKPCPAGCMDARVTSQVIAASSDLALFVDQAGVIQDVTTGESEPGPAWKSLIGKRWVETAARDSQAKVEQLLQEAREGTTPRSREINQLSDGAAGVPFRFSAVLLDREQRVVALGRDLRAVSAVQQELVVAQQAMDREYVRLRQAETRYRLLFQVTAEGVVVANMGTRRVLETNQAATALFREEASALKGRPLEELFDAATWPTLQAHIAAIESGARSVDVKVALHGGTEAVVTPQLFRQGGTTLLLLRVRGAGTAERTPGSRDSQMMAVLDTLPDAIVVVDEEDRILCANTSFCDLVQQVGEQHVIGQPIERWLGRPGVDLSILKASLREHGAVRNFATIVRGEYGADQEAVVSGVSALDGKVPCLGFAIRTAPARSATAKNPLPRSIDQLRELVGRVSLKEIVRESADLVERLCIEAALQVSNDNRALAAQLLGLSRQGLYSKLRRHGLGDLDPGNE